MAKMEKEMVGETGAQTGHKSRPHRHALQLKSVLAIPALDRQVKARIRNISAGGLMAETPLPIGRGERVEIDLPNIGYALIFPIATISKILIAQLLLTFLK